jgi:hypothetical protein
MTMTSRSLFGSLAVVALASAVPCTFALQPLTALVAAEQPLTALVAAEQEVKGRPAQKPQKAEMAMPKPAPEMAQLKFFDGNWTCEGTMLPGPFGPGGKMTSTVKSHADLGGFWQSGVVKGTGAGMPAFEGMFHMTYDPAAKRHVMLWVDNMGAWAQSTAPGWEGDKIVFTGDSSMGGKKFATRDTFVKGAGGTFKRTGEMQQDGKWTALGDETCRKAGMGAAKK